MNINIYCKYKVEEYYKGSYISQEDSLPGDYAYSSYDDHKTYETSGGELLDNIGKMLLDSDLSEYIRHDNTMTFEFFDCFTGEGSTKTLEIIEVGKQQEGDVDES